MSTSTLTGLTGPAGSSQSPFQLAQLFLADCFWQRRQHHVLWFFLPGKSIMSFYREYLILPSQFPGEQLYQFKRLCSLLLIIVVLLVFLISWRSSVSLVVMVQMFRHFSLSADHIFVCFFFALSGARFCILGFKLFVQHHTGWGLPSLWWTVTVHWVAKIYSTVKSKTNSPCTYNWARLIITNYCCLCYPATVKRHYSNISSVQAWAGVVQTAPWNKSANLSSHI